MFLRIERLELKRIKCFDSITLDFNKGVNVISGPNGSGKSTILTSIGFGLFGANYLAGLPYNSDDMIKRGKKSGRIKLEFATSQGRFICIHTIRKSSNNDWKLYQHSRSSPIAVTISESREIIRKLLGGGIDHDTFKNALCSRQGELTQLLDSPPYQRKDQIRKVMGLQNFDKAKNIMNQFNNQLEQKIENISDKIDIIKKVRTDPKQLKSDKSSLEDEKSKLLALKIKEKEELEELESELNILENLHEKITTESNDLQRLQSNLKEHETELKKENVKLEKYFDNSDFNCINLEEAKEKRTALNRKYQSLLDSKNKLQLSLDKYNENKEKLSKLLEDVGEIESEINSHQKLIEKEFSNFNLEIAEEKLSDLQSNYAYFEERKNNLLEEITSIQDNIELLENQYQMQIKEIKEYNKDFEKWFGNSPDEIEIVENSLEKRSNSLKNAVSRLEKYTEDNIKKSSNIEGEIKVINNTLKIIQDSSREHNCPVCRRNMDKLNYDELQEFHSKRLNQKKNERNELIGIIETQKENLTKLRERLDNINDLFSKFEEYKKQYSTYKEWENQKNKLVEKLELEMKKKNSKEKELSKLEKTSSTDLKNEINSLATKIDKFQSLKEKIKSLSKDKMNKKEEITVLQEEMEDINVENLNKNLEESKSNIQKVKSTLNDLNEKIIPSLERRNSIMTNITKTKTKVKTVKIQLKGLREDFDRNKFNDLKEEKETKMQVLANTNANIKVTKEKLDEIEKKIDQTQEQENELIELEQKVSEYKHLLPETLQIKKIFEETPSQLINTISSEISVYLTNMVTRLLPDNGYEKILFKNEGEIILYNNGSEVDKSNLSGGEKTVVSLALRMGLADYVAPLNFLILDEPTNYLDKQRVEEFMEIIDRENIFTKTTGQLLLVTHRNEFDRNAQNSIRLSINNGKRELH